MINDPLRYVAVPYAELKALLEMARDISKSSPWGQTNTQAWNPDIEQLPELGSEVPTIAGIVGESNTVLISMPDFEAIKALMPVVGSNNNWWINGVDSGVSAVPDTTKVLRPPILIRFPAITNGANPNEVLISGGLVTVYNGTDKVLEVPIVETVVDIYNKPMVVVGIDGIPVAKDTTDAILDAVPLFYAKHVVYGTVNIQSDITFALSASELSFYIQTLRDIKLVDVDAVNKQVDEALATMQNVLADSISTVQALINDIEAQAANKLIGVPRILAFNAWNSSGFNSGDTIAYYIADHTFNFPDNFAGSLAGYTATYGNAYPAEISILGIFNQVGTNSEVRIGSLQISTDGVITFVMYQSGYTVLQGSKLLFKVDSMTYIESVSLTLVHTLES